MMFMPLAPTSAQAVKVKRAPATAQGVQPGKGEKSKGGDKQVTLPTFNANSTSGAPNISATKDDNRTSAQGAIAGDTINYTVVITNNGTADATGVTFNDVPDPNTSLVGGSIQTQPVTQPDSYTASGNIPISIAAPGVLANDSDPDTGNNSGLTITKVQGSGANVGVATATTATGLNSTKGSVTLSSTGGFTYEPPPGFDGNDTFTYEVSDGTFTDTNTVTITISGMVWFIDNSASSSSNQGTFSNPFKTIAAFNTANTGVAPHPKTGDYIALRTGTGTYSEADGIDLFTSQILIGNAVQFNTVFTADANSSAAYTTFAAGTNTAPTITTTTTGNNGVDLASNNTVRGLNVGNTTGGFKINGNVVGSPTINTINLTGTGGAIQIIGSGTFGSNVNIGTLESTSTTSWNIHLTSVTGTLGITSGGAGLTNSSGNENILIDGGSVSMSYPGNITQSGGGTSASLLKVQNGHNTGTLTFTGTLSATNGNGLQFNNADGTYNFNGTTTLNGGDAGVDILNNSSGTFSFSSNTTITSPSGTAFNVNSSSPSVTYSGNITQNTSAQRVVNIDTTASNTITFQTGTITGGASSAGININAANGNVTFSNGMTLGTSGARYTNATPTPAVTITGGTGTYSLGAVSIFTSGVQGIVATNADGTINASGTIDTTAASAGATAAAINIDGPAGLTTLGINMTKVSANNSTYGIQVQDTNGTFTITGTSTTDGTGGTISNITNRGASFINAAGISLSNMTFTNVGTANGADPINSGSTCGDLGPAGGGNTGCNAGIHLDTVNGVTLTNVDMNGGKQEGINGNSVTNFVLANSNVLNFGDQVREDGLKFRNMLGTSSISNTTITGNQAIQVHVENLSGGSSGSPATLTITDSDINTSSAPNGGQGIIFDSHQTAVAKLKIQGDHFSNLFSNCIDALGDGSNTPGNGGLDLVVDGTATAAARRNTFVGCGASGITLAQDGSSDVRFNIHDNGTSGSPTFLTAAAPYNFVSHDININQAGNATSNAVMQGAITNNFIGNNSSASSASTGGYGIEIDTIAPGTQTVLVSGNTVQGAIGGIEANLGEDTNASHKLNITLLNNSATVTNANGFDAIRINSGTLTNDVGTTCGEVSGNTGSATVGNDINVRQRKGTTFQLRGYAGGNTDTAAVQTYLDNTEANNAAHNVWFITTEAPGGGFVNSPGPGGQCAQPTLPSIANPIGDIIPPPASAAQQQPAASNDITSHPFVALPAPANGAKAKAQVAASAQLGTAQQTQQATATKSVGGSSKSAKPTTHVISAAQAGSFPLNIGTLAPGDSVTIQFSVTVNNGNFSTVSNQGTVSGSNFSNVLTDDPTVGGAADPTVTNITPPPAISVHDAKATEPATGTASMPFTVTLNHAYPQTVTVNYATADGTATGGTCGTSGIDYQTTSNTLTFLAGEVIKVVNVPVCADNGDNTEADETFTLNLSGSSANSSIATPTGTGTITTSSTAGTLIISEFRQSGPGGGTDSANDDFVELYNNTNSPLTIAASDASGGYGLYKAGTSCSDAPILVAQIPNGTIIPARGHYLLVGSSYSLANYGGTGAAAGNQTMTADLENDRSVALFTTGTLANISSLNRLDGVGAAANTGGACDLMGEGTGLVSTTGAGSDSEYSFTRKLTSGTPQDTNDNASDFMLVSTTPATTIGGNSPTLGAPGPENSSSPINRGDVIKASLINPCVSSSGAPNRDRNLTPDIPNNSTLGTLSIRRRFTNNTGATVTRLRFRIVDITTRVGSSPPPAGTADLRVRTSPQVTGLTTCNGTTTVQALTLETPPNQPNGGGFNSTVSSGTVTISGLAPNAVIDVNFLLGVQQSGSFRFFIIVEALP
jgi:hypothetical protein